jgi:hypothetical protein
MNNKSTAWMIQKSLQPNGWSISYVQQVFKILTVISLELSKSFDLKKCRIYFIPASMVAKLVTPEKIFRNIGILKM